MIGENGILSTPAISTIIRRYGTTGGIILTASHNPGGPKGDFGLKYNIDNGGPAPEDITNEIYEITTKIKEIHTLNHPIPMDLSKIGTTDYKLNNGKTFKVTIVSSTQDYVNYMKEIFDFDMIKQFLAGGQGKYPFKVLVSGLSGGKVLVNAEYERISLTWLLNSVRILRYIFRCLSVFPLSTS